MAQPDPAHWRSSQFAWDPTKLEVHNRVDVSDDSWEDDGVEGSGARGAPGVSPLHAGEYVSSGGRQRQHNLPKGPLNCQVEGCGKDLTIEKSYYQRYRVCEAHLKMLSLMVDGRPSRFCQQCGRFHELTEFDGNKRSCRERLAQHNARRRKRGPVNGIMDTQAPAMFGKRGRGELDMDMQGAYNTSAFNQELGHMDQRVLGTLQPNPNLTSMAAHTLTLQPQHQQQQQQQSALQLNMSMFNPLDAALFLGGMPMQPSGFVRLEGLNHQLQLQAHQLLQPYASQMASLGFAGAAGLEAAGSLSGRSLFAGTNSLGADGAVPVLQGFAAGGGAGVAHAQQVQDAQQGQQSNADGGGGGGGGGNVGDVAGQGAGGPQLQLQPQPVAVSTNTAQGSMVWLQPSALKLDLTNGTAAAASNNRDQLADGSRDGSAGGAAGLMLNPPSISSSATCFVGNNTIDKPYMKELPMSAMLKNSVSNASLAAGMGGATLPTLNLNPSIQHVHSTNTLERGSWNTSAPTLNLSSRGSSTLDVNAALGNANGGVGLNLAPAGGGAVAAVGAPTRSSPASATDSHANANSSTNTASTNILQQPPTLSLQLQPNFQTYHLHNHSSLQGFGHLGNGLANMAPMSVQSAGAGATTIGVRDSSNGLSGFDLARMLVAGGGSQATYQSEDNLVRLSLKIANCTPDQLPHDMLDKVRALLASADASLLQGFLRPGCTHLVLDVLHHSHSHSDGGRMAHLATPTFEHAGVSASTPSPPAPVVTAPIPMPTPPRTAHPSELVLPLQPVPVPTHSSCRMAAAAPSPEPLPALPAERLLSILGQQLTGDPTRTITVQKDQHKIVFVGGELQQPAEGVMQHPDPYHSVQADHECRAQAGAAGVALCHVTPAAVVRGAQKRAVLYVVGSGLDSPDARLFLRMQGGYSRVDSCQQLSTEEASSWVPSKAAMAQGMAAGTSVYRVCVSRVPGEGLGMLEVQVSGALLGQWRPVLFVRRGRRVCVEELRAHCAQLLLAHAAPGVGTHSVDVDAVMASVYGLVVDAGRAVDYQTVMHVYDHHQPQQRRQPQHTTDTVQAPQDAQWESAAGCAQKPASKQTLRLSAARASARVAGFCTTAGMHHTATWLTRVCTALRARAVTTAARFGGCPAPPLEKGEPAAPSQVAAAASVSPSAAGNDASWVSASAVGSTSGEARVCSSSARVAAASAAATRVSACGTAGVAAPPTNNKPLLGSVAANRVISNAVPRATPGVTHKQVWSQFVDSCSLASLAALDTGAGSGCGMTALTMNGQVARRDACSSWVC